MNGVGHCLVIYLDSIDERLLDYLDEDDELRPEVVKRLRYYTTALLDGTITPAAVAEDWADWFDLVRAFVVAYAPEASRSWGRRPQFKDDEDVDRHRAQRGGPGLPGDRRTPPRRLPRDAAGGVAHSAGKALSTASDRSASERCRYRVVVAMLEWPSRRWTTWMSAPRRRRLVA